MRNEVKGERERKGRRMMRYDVKGEERKGGKKGDSITLQLGKGKGGKGEKVSLRGLSDGRLGVDTISVKKCRSRKGRNSLRRCVGCVIARKAQVDETIAPTGGRYGDEDGDGRSVY